MIQRYLSERVAAALGIYPAVAILGPRQVGKTTLALSQLHITGSKTSQPPLYLDLERPSDLTKLTDAERFLSAQQDRLVIIDEVQRRPDLFPLLRSLIDAHRVPGRFLLLGSASEALVGLSSESLAGRVSYQELHPLVVPEVGVSNWEALWVRGGYPPAYPSGSDEAGLDWVGNFVRTYLERELGASSLRVRAAELSQFLRLVSSVHGQLVNYSQLSQAVQLSMPTVKQYIQFSSSRTCSGCCRRGWPMCRSGW